MGPSDLRTHGVAQDLIDRWAAEFEAFTDVQEQAVRAGLFETTTNLLIAAPTSSGKTFVGEMAAAAGAQAGRRHAIFAVPFKALAVEHFARLEARYRDLMRVVISDGDHSEFDADMAAGAYSLAVCTYEKLQYLVGQHPSLLDQLSVVVVDEVQMVADPHRGPELELMLTRFLTGPNPPRVVALSASLDELGTLSHWLGATAVISRERPIPLTEAVADFSGSVYVPDGEGRVEPIRSFPPSYDLEGAIDSACRALVEEGQQVLVFRAQVGKTVETANRLAALFRAEGLEASLATEIAALEDPDVRAAFQRLLASGVAYHNADLGPEERTVVEQAFRSGKARILVSTTTLAMGVNLPSDWTLIADTVRWNGGRRTDIGVAEYKNAAGRAGRLGARTEGHSLLFAGNPADRRMLVNTYVLGEPEPVRSQLPRRPIEDIAFSILGSGLLHTEDELVEFLPRTLAYLTDWEPQGDAMAGIRRSVKTAIEKCLASGLTVEQEGRYLATDAAKRYAHSGICLASAVRLNEAVALAEAGASDADILMLVALCREAGDRPWPQRRYGQSMDPRPAIPWSRIPREPGGRLDRLATAPVIEESDMSAILRLICLLEWMDGRPTRELTRAYQGMAPVRLGGMAEGVASLISAMSAGSASRLAGQPAEARLRSLEQSCRYGVPIELVGLARLRVRGVGRDVLMPLMNLSEKARLESDALLEASPGDLENLVTAVQLSALQAAIEKETADSIGRRRAGQQMRARNQGLSEQLIADLYTKDAKPLEHAVFEALTYMGLTASPLPNQPHGEEDIRLVHPNGTVVISVTASVAEGKPIRWTKANEVLGQGAGLNPINCVCIGRPRFESLAVIHASQIGRETGGRKILLLTMPALGEILLRFAEGRLTTTEVADVFALRSGVLDVEDLPEETTGDDELNAT